MTPIGDVKLDLEVRITLRLTVREMAKLFRLLECSEILLVTLSPCTKKSDETPVEFS